MLRKRKNKRPYRTANIKADIHTKIEKIANKEQRDLQVVLNRLLQAGIDLEESKTA